MRSAIDEIKRAVPKPAKVFVRRLAYRVRNIRFKPYLKKKTIEGVTFDFWIGDTEGRDWYDLHCPDPDWTEMRFIRDHMVEQGDVILECGGHHGCTAILLSNWVGTAGKVITFEALPRNCDIIERNLKQNSLQNVTLERKAVGAEKGKVIVSGLSNSLVMLTGLGIEVDLACLDEYMHLNPTFLKIDVEGFEVAVLKGAKRILSTRPKLAIEVHTGLLAEYGASLEDIFRLIGVENYEIWIQWEVRIPGQGDRDPEVVPIRIPKLI